MLGELVTHLSALTLESTVHHPALDRITRSVEVTALSLMTLSPRTATSVVLVAEAVGLSHLREVAVLVVRVPLVVLA